jgi:uncharacterized membrane protein YfcA
LLGKYANKNIVLRFGIPSLLAAFLGAYCLSALSGFPSILQYELSGKQFGITPVKLIIALLLIYFSLAEVFPVLLKLKFRNEQLVAGGLLSGFFGGLSGNQGALRSAFLIKAGLSKEQFLATGIVIACLVDIARLSIYSEKYVFIDNSINYKLLAASVICAFAGAFLGNKFLKKVTVVAVQRLVMIFLLIFALLLGTGIL